MTDLAPAQTEAPPRLQRPAGGPMARWPQSTDLLIALASFFLTLVLWSRGTEDGSLELASFADVGTFVCAFAGNMALLWRRTHPLQVHAAALGASLLVLLGSMTQGIFAVAFSLYSLGRYEGDVRLSATGMIAATAFVARDLFLLQPLSAGGVLATAIVVAIWYLGRRLRFRGEYLRLLEERADHLEREQLVEAERAVVAERARIAREMHDIVAHQLSLMTVQAGAAKTVSRSDPEAAREAMAAVEKAGRQAVSEMRQLLGVLRPAETRRELAPQPAIDDVPALVREVRDVGPDVQLSLAGATSKLPARLGLAVYRIVQEALTNVIRHAGTGAVVEVLVDVRSDSVVVQVQDDGIGKAAEASGGHGLIGMRERVELLGGAFDAGPGEEGGFEVRAVLPIEGGEN